MRFNVLFSFNGYSIYEVYLYVDRCNMYIYKNNFLKKKKYCKFWVRISN